MEALECCSSGGSAPLTATATISDTDYILDKTWQEISDAFPNVRIVVGEIKYAITEVGKVGSHYYVLSPDSINYDGYETDSPTGYPSYSQEIQ